MIHSLHSVEEGEMKLKPEGLIMFTVSFPRGSPFRRALLDPILVILGCVEVVDPERAFNWQNAGAAFRKKR